MIDCEIGAQLDLSALGTVAFGRFGSSRNEVGSTNDELWAAADHDAPHGTLCVARAQTAGRGRQSRSWRSDPDRGLYFSLLLRPRTQLDRLPAFSLVAALTVAETLEAMAGVATQLKWPNDVWVEHRKICGILLESRAAAEPKVVVGIGLNLAPPAGGWMPPLAGSAISLREAGVELDRTRLLVGLLESLESSYDLFEARGLAPFARGWQARSVLTGRRVEVEMQTHRFAAIAEHVDEAGCLVVRGADGRRVALNAGEVHLVMEPNA